MKQLSQLLNSDTQPEKEIHTSEHQEAMYAIMVKCYQNLGIAESKIDAGLMAQTIRLLLEQSNRTGETPPVLEACRAFASGKLDCVGQWKAPQVFGHPTPKNITDIITVYRRYISSKKKKENQKLLGTGEKPKWQNQWEDLIYKLQFFKDNGSLPDKIFWCAYEYKILDEQKYIFIPTPQKKQAMETALRKVSRDKYGHRIAMSKERQLERQKQYAMQICLNWYMEKMDKNTLTELIVRMKNKYAQLLAR
jgi:hypothetical protein